MVFVICVIRGRSPTYVIQAKVSDNASSKQPTSYRLLSNSQNVRLGHRARIDRALNAADQVVSARQVMHLQAASFSGLARSA